MSDIKDNKKIINGWVLFDWANSVYPLVILSTIFPVYFTEVAVTKGEDVIVLFGLEFINTFVLDVILAASYLLVAFLIPLLSGVADVTGKKKSFMKMFNYIGVLGCLLLFFFTRENIEIGLLGSFFASVGYSGSLVFYNAYLPEIASLEQQDAVSAKGFAFGYLGGAVFLVLTLAVLFLFEANADRWMFLKEVESVKHLVFRYAFLVLCIWWWGFAQITFRRLPSNVFKKEEQVDKWKKGFRELKKVLNEVKQSFVITRYLTAYFVFALAVQTMLLVAAFFGKKEVALPEGYEDIFLIGLILLIQLVGMLGARFFAWFSSRQGNIVALVFGLLSYLSACVLAFFTYTAVSFIILGVLVGFGMGGIQSLARSTYSKMLPETEDHTSYFSLFDFIEKVSIVLGLLLYGGLEQVTGSQRISVLVLGSVFVISILLLLKLIKMKHQPSLD